MHRTQIYIDRSQQKILRSIAHERSATISQLIREAVSHFVLHYQNKKQEPKKGLKGIIGLYNNPEDRLGSVNHDDIYD